MRPEEFAALLAEVRATTDARLRAEFNRSLPFADAQFDRWERAKALGFGDGSTIYDSSLVFGKVTVGRDVWIGPFTLLDGSGGALRIGDCCDISAGVHIYTHDTVLRVLSGKNRPPRQAPVHIGARTYIGSQSVIGAGVSIGEQCVVGANSFVSDSVPDRTIVGGSPAERLGSVRVEGDDVRLDYD